MQSMENGKAFIQLIVNCFTHCFVDVLKKHMPVAPSLSFPCSKLGVTRKLQLSLFLTLPWPMANAHYLDLRNLILWVSCW